MNSSFSLSSNEIIQYCRMLYQNKSKTQGFIIVPITILTELTKLINFNYIKITCKLTDEWDFDPPQRNYIFINPTQIIESIELIWSIKRIKSGKKIWPLAIEYHGSETNFT